MDSILTQKVPRSVLADMAGNHRLIKLLEAIISDVSTALPGGLNEIDAAAQIAYAVAVQALTLAQVAQGLVASLDAGPPRAEIVLPDIPQDSYALLSALRDRVATLELAVAQLSERPTP